MVLKRLNLSYALFSDLRFVKVGLFRRTQTLLTCLAKYETDFKCPLAPVMNVFRRQLK